MTFGCQPTAHIVHIGLLLTKIVPLFGSSFQGAEAKLQFIPDVPSPPPLSANKAQHF
jgi:hypothetical protein